MTEFSIAVDSALFDLKRDVKRYEKAYNRYKAVGIALRTAAFFALAFGVIIPLSYVFVGGDQNKLISIGYLCLVVSGLILLCDTTFSVSATRVGYLTAYTNLQFLQERFVLGKTLAELAEGAGEAGAVSKFIESSIAERQKVVWVETSKWIEMNVQALEVLKGKVDDAVNQAKKNTTPATKP
ncbi:hypothetical protein [Paracoccus yeei]|uniref:hypothetical protein n=1 Tax=Paracoccus yeei TaxID=147645 RepID=UPI00117C53F9|nr:hypothetical protein [Paracoccus yeei]